MSIEDELNDLTSQFNVSQSLKKGNIGIELMKPKSLLSEFEYFFSEDKGRYIIEISKSECMNECRGMFNFTI